MKIDKYTKQSIVRAIMADVPKPDNEKRRIDLQGAVVKAMSPAVRKVFKETPGALRTHHFGDLIDTGVWGSRELIVGDVSKDTLTALAKPYVVEDTARREAEYKLKQAIESCNTLKQLNDRLPEFKKYFPAEEAPLSKNLPALANVVADLSKLGWPKK
jgi:hypothetical protein